MTAYNDVRPTDWEIAAAYDQLDENAEAFYQERAGIREFVHGQTRADAKRIALADVRDF